MGLNTVDTLYASDILLDGEPAEAVRSRVDARTIDFATYVSELDGRHEVSVVARDAVREVVGQDTLYASREATATLRAEIERTYWQRLVTGSAAYESNVRAVFHDARSSLWVQLNGYPQTFWSSRDGASFTKRRDGFERFMASDGDTAWIEYTTAGSGGDTFLARVDLATGTNVEAYQVFFNDRLHAGAAHAGTFYGIHQGRRALMTLQGDKVAFIESGPYAYPSGTGTLVDYHISPDGTHWLITTDRGVQRNDGAGWSETAGLAPTVALSLAGGPDGSVWVMEGDGGRCAVKTWDGARWAERAVFERDGNSSCGVFGIGATGSVWRGTTDGWIVRSRGGAIDRRYRADAATSVGIQGSTVWVGTGYGLRQILDHENE